MTARRRCATLECISSTARPGHDRRSRARRLGLFGHGRDSRLRRAVLWANRALMIAALGAMAVMVFVSVSLRYLTDDAILWAEELSRYLMIWLTLIGVGPVLRLGGHVAVDNLHVAVPPAAYASSSSRRPRRLRPTLPMRASALSRAPGGRRRRCCTSPSPMWRWRRQSASASAPVQGGPAISRRCPMRDGEASAR
jgi:hypothetical protein